MIAIDENFRISETGGTGNATIFVNATTENPFSTASTQIEVSSSVGNIKRYVTLNKKAAHGYMYTPVEWISNEDINSQIWIDLGYTWTNTSKAEIGMIIPTGNTANGTEIFGEWFDWTYRSGQYEPVSDTDDLRLFFDGSKCYWDTPNNNRTQLAYEKGKAIIWQFGNQYLNNVNKKTTATGATVDIGTRTSTVGLFGAPASGGYTHKARFYYVKIWEGDTLVRDIIPVLDKDNIPCFLDKANATFYYYKVNGVPSTGLTAGGAIAEYSYIDNGGVNSSYNCYIPINYVWKTNSRAVMSLKVQSAQSGHIFSDEDGSNRLRLYPNSYGQFQMEYRGTTINSSSRSWSNVQNIEMGNYYIKDTDTGTDIATGATKTANQTSYCFLFGYSDKIQYYSVKIYEGDTLVCDLVPAMANNGYKGFWDKKREQFFFDRNNQNSRLYVGTKVQDIVVTQIYSESDITINNETPSTAINTTFNLNASTTPTGATLSYSSSDTSIATVDSNGVVTAVGKGTATITITAQGFQDNVNKVYYNTTSKTVSVECEAAHGYSYTPVEYVSNEGLLDKHWVDLDYIWKDNSKVQLGFYSVYTNIKESWQVFGEDNQFDANGNVINDTDDVRLFLYNDSAYWDVTNRRVQRSSWSTSLYNNWHNVELGNNYVKDIDTGNQTTGSTYSISRTNTVGLFGSPKYALSNTDRIRYKYIKIYEGDTLVKDIIPVLDSNNIPCFYDKVNGTFHYYKVNGVPSTGLTAGNAIQQLEYLQGDGTDYIITDYIATSNTRIEVDCSGRPASTPSSRAGAGTVMGCEIWNSSQPSSAQGGISIGFPGGGGVSFYYGTLSYANNTSQKIIERGVFKLDGSAAYIDDFKVADVTTSFVTQGGPFALFNSLIYNSSNGTTFPISSIYSDAYYEGRIYGVKIYENNVLVRDYVPCTGTLTRGFYDRISGNYLTSVNGSLITGTVIGDLTISVIYTESDITISNETPSTAISVGNTFNLNTSTTPTGATLSYSSSDTSIATVDNSGIVTAVGKGNATITITAQGFNDDVNKVHYNTTSKAVSVECAYPTQQITITKDTPSETIGIEGTFDLNVSTTPTGATVTYSSSDTSVATVSNQGIVTGVATGTTTITIVAEGFDDDVNHITYTSTSTTVSVTVADGKVETYDFMNGDGNDYIITDYAPNRNSVIEVKYENQGGIGDLIGFENRSTSETFRFEDNILRITVYGNNSSVYTDSKKSGVIKQNGNKVEFNGSVIGSTDYISNTDNLPLYIFASNSNNLYGNHTYQGRIFYVKVWENDTLVHEWVGATKGNKVGVYDTVTSVFTASQYNDLTVGNEVLPEDSKYFLIKATSSEQGISPDVSFRKKGTPSGSLYYRKLNDTAWTEVTGNTSVVLAGETGYVELKGSIHNDEVDQWQIEGTNIEPQGYLAAIARNEEITSSNNSIAGTYAKFYNLFNGNYNLTNITNIIFPTDTDPACYEGMFINCAQITTAPILPATRLRSECYKEMFKNCYSLRTIPSAMLPATALTEDCYYSMFEGCSAITTGPDLPAPSTTQGCYYRMFYDCIALTELRVFFTDTPATSYINYWLSNIWLPGTLYAPSNATYTESDLQLPSSWTLSKTL